MSISKNVATNLSVQVYNTSGQPFVPSVWPNDATAKMYIITDGGTSATEVVPTRQDPLTGFWRLNSSILTNSVMNCDELKVSWSGTGIQTGGSIYLTEATFTDTVGGSLSTFLTDFSGVVRPWILQIYNAVYDTISGRTILQRLGAFTGTGSNTVLGFFLALLRKDVPIPTDIGGTYDDANHSLQAIRERGDAAWITGAGGGGSMSYALKLVTGSVTETLQFNQQFTFGANGQTRIVDVLQGSVVIYPTAALASALEGGISQGKGEQVYQLTAEAILVAQENNTIVTISGNVA